MFCMRFTLWATENTWNRINNAVKNNNNCCHLMCSGDMFFWSLRHLLLLVKCFVHITCLYVCIRDGLFLSLLRTFNWIYSIYVTVSLFHSFITFVINFVLAFLMVICLISCSRCFELAFLCVQCPHSIQLGGSTVILVIIVSFFSYRLHFNTCVLTLVWAKLQITRTEWYFKV